MKDKFTVNFDRLAETVVPQRAYRLKDVEHRIEKVAYDLVRFRENEDTDQLWKIEDGGDGPVIVALYGEDGSLPNVESSVKRDWEVISDKTAMHFYYKGEPLVSLSSDQLGIPETEFNIAGRWLPQKLASDERFQMLLLNKVNRAGRVHIAQRFPELTKVADVTEDDWEDESLENEERDYEQEHLGGGNVAEAMDEYSMSGPDNYVETDVEELAESLKAVYSDAEIKELVDELRGGVPAMFDMGMAYDMSNPNEEAIPTPKVMAARIQEKLSDDDIERLVELLTENEVSLMEPGEGFGELDEKVASKIW